MNKLVTSILDLISIRNIVLQMLDIDIVFLLMFFQYTHMYACVGIGTYYIYKVVLVVYV